ncbi:unnamed protein product [Fructobacillus fructosus]|uniref:Uncharacterized protein n=1 Tax=Fructobacillus fructosus TaxID=1631 RepID=A0ABM9MWK5_9LACO|nr:unnamed protein product [Fructobacillus fructosus]
MAIWLYFNMKKQDNSNILLNLIDDTFETQARLTLFSDYIRRLSDELTQIATTTPQRDLAKLLDLAVSELIGEVQALDDQIEHADELRQEVGND